MVWGIWGFNWWNNTANGTLLDMLYPFHTLENPTGFIQQCTEVADPVLIKSNFKRTYVIIVRLVMTRVTMLNLTQR